MKEELDKIATAAHDAIMEMEGVDGCVIMFMTANNKDDKHGHMDSVTFADGALPIGTVYEKGVAELNSIVEEAIKQGVSKAMLDASRLKVLKDAASKILSDINAYNVPRGATGHARGGRL